MIKVIIPEKYILDDNVNDIYDDPYTVWIDPQVLTWVNPYDPKITYQALTGYHSIYFQDDAVAALFKLTFPPV